MKRLNLLTFSSVFLVFPITVQAGCDDLLQSGVTTSGDTFCFGAPGLETGIRAGTTGAGNISIRDSAVVNLESANLGQPIVAPSVIIGRLPGGIGTLEVSGAGSELNIDVFDAPDDSSIFHVGREGIGTAIISDGGSVNILELGGPLSATPGNGGNITIGRSGGTGTVSLDDGDINYLDRDSANVFVGRLGGLGTLAITNGSTMTVEGMGERKADAFANISLGVGDGSVGIMTVEDSTLNLRNPSGNGANLNVGRDDGAQGFLTLQKGASVEIFGASSARFDVAREDGSLGNVTISDGSVLDVSGPNGDIRIGAEGGGNGSVSVNGGSTLSASDDVEIGTAFGGSDGGTGRLSITGGGTALIAGDQIIVGAPNSFGGGLSSGDLVVGSGGKAIANEIYIGAGGTVKGNDGDLIGSVILDGGSLQPGASPGVLNIDGDLEILGGLLDFEIFGRDSGQYDLLNISGDFIAKNPFDIHLSLGSFLPELGETFDFLSIDGDTVGLVELLDLEQIELSIFDAPTGYAFDLAFEGGTFGAMVTGVSPVPLPAPVFLMLASMGFLAATGRRKKS